MPFGTWCWAGSLDKNRRQEVPDLFGVAKLAGNTTGFSPFG